MEHQPIEPNYPPPLIEHALVAEVNIFVADIFVGMLIEGLDGYESEPDDKPDSPR